MGPLKAVAGDESRARRLAIDNITLELILTYVRELCREQSISEMGSTAASDEVETLEVKPSLPCGMQKGRAPK